MAIETEVLGEQLAADIAAQARAHDELARTARWSPMRFLLVNTAILVAGSVILERFGEQTARAVVLALTVCVVTVMMELSRLSRRLDAALSLLELQSGRPR